jgi:hypothetical protein
MFERIYCDFMLVFQAAELLTLSLIKPFVAQCRLRKGHSGEAIARNLQHNFKLSAVEITDCSEDASDGDSYIMTLNTSPTKKRHDDMDHAEVSNIEICDWPMFSKDISKGPMERGQLLNKPSPPSNEASNKKMTMWSNEIDDYYDSVVGARSKKGDDMENIAKDDGKYLGRIVVQAMAPTQGAGGGSRSMSKGLSPAMSTPRTPRTPERAGSSHLKIESARNAPSEHLMVTTPRTRANHPVLQCHSLVIFLSYRKFVYNFLYMCDMLLMLSPWKCAVMGSKMWWGIHQTM